MLLSLLANQRKGCLVKNRAMPELILSCLLMLGIVWRCGSASDLETLIVFGSTINVPGWRGNASDCCTWKGVNCDSSGSIVRRIDISGLGVSGDLSPLADLRDLESLDVSKNSFGGSIPSVFGNLSQLEFLDLSWNNFSGVIPDGLRELSNLRSLNISNNHLSGRIPQWISEFQRLEALVAYENSLKGEIPQKLGGSSNLKLLNLHSNGLEGTIPVSVFGRGLQVLVLTGNYLSGVLPESVGNCRYLSSLRVGNNNLTGVIPKSIGESISLTYFEADGNYLSGEIPSEFASCSNLTLMNLMYNQLRGSIPANLGALANLEELIFAGNNLSGEIPSSIFAFSSLTKMDLSENRLSGTISREIGKMTRLQYLLLGDNLIGGMIPREIGSCVKLLELQIGGNSLSGKIPPEIGRLRNLQISLNLSNNNLNGELPPELGKLDKLVSLEVSHNQLSGEIPLSFKGMLSLIELNFSHNLLSGPLPSFGPFLKSPSSSFLPNGNLCGAPVNLSCSGADSTVGGRKVPLKIVIVVIASGSTVFLAVIIVVVLFTMREREEKLMEIEAPCIQAGHIFAESYRQAIDLDAVMKATFKESNKISSGTFSTLYKAVMPSGTVLYARKLKAVIHHQSKMIRELERLSQLSHANLVCPIGYVIYENSAILLHRYLPNRTLAELLHESTKTAEYQPDWETRLSIAVGVAEGLAFLHHVAIIHLDVSSGNVFLDSDNNALVGEVEIWKLLDPSKGSGSISAVAGSFGYIPPEYAYTMHVTAAGNVYSYGVVLLEILTSRKAVDEVFGEGMDLVQWVHGASGRGETPEQILDARLSTVSFGWRKEMLAALKVALLCTDSSPAKRPRMKKVVEMLLKVKEN